MTAMTEPAAADPPLLEEDSADAEASLFSGKKKKATRRVPQSEGEDQPQPTEKAPPKPSADEEAEFLASISRPKRKKKREPAPKRAEAVEQQGGYSYEFLLQRLYQGLHHANPDVLTQRRIVVKPPNVVRDGTKKSAFVNFSEICESLHRSEEHVLAFIVSELATSGSIDANSCLILKGRFQNKHIEGVLRKYIQEYVMCAMCRSLDTVLEKDQHSRLYHMACTRCNAGRTVQQISQGFRGQVQRRRKK